MITNVIINSFGYEVFAFSILGIHVGVLVNLYEDTVYICNKYQSPLGYL